MTEQSMLSVSLSVKPTNCRTENIDTLHFRKEVLTGVGSEQLAPTPMCEDDDGGTARVLVGALLGELLQQRSHAFRRHIARLVWTLIGARVSLYEYGTNQNIVKTRVSQQ